MYIFVYIHTICTYVFENGEDNLICHFTSVYTKCSLSYVVEICYSGDEME